MRPKASQCSIDTAQRCAVEPMTAKGLRDVLGLRPLFVSQPMRCGLIRRNGWYHVGYVCPLMSGCFLMESD